MTPASVLATLLASTLACSDGSGPPAGSPGLTIDRRPAVTTDSALARIAQPVEVTVRGAGGAPAAGVIVRFEASGTPADGVRRAVYACGGDATCGSAVNGGGRVMDVVTDANGRARSYVRHGEVAGAAWLHVSVPSLEYRDSIAVTTNPGAAVELSGNFADTLVAVGATLDVDAAVRDRHGNALPAEVTLSSSAGVRAEGDGTLTAQAAGIHDVTVTGGGYARTLHVTVVPGGWFAATREIGATGDSLLLSTFDGRQQQRLYVPNTNPMGLKVELLADRSAIIYLDRPEGSGLRMMERSLTTGVVRDITPSGVTLAEADQAPSASLDGNWIYFRGVEADEVQPGVAGDTVTIWRMRRDGTAPKRVGRVPTDYFGSASRPESSPDGSKVAYITRMTCCNERVEVADSNGVVTRFDTPAQYVTWSRDGAWLFLASFGTGQIGFQRVHADGTGLETVARPPGEYYAPFDYTADSRWLVATAWEGLLLIGPESGKTILVPNSYGYRQPSAIP